MVKRRSKILEFVSKNKKVEVTKLSEFFNVSQVTIRKDLDSLEERGLLKREHGFALLNNMDDINSRLAVKYEVKRNIAKLAASTVSDGEIVMIESGSCCALLAEELVKKKDITIITNSAFIAGYIRECPNCKLILIGGDYQAKSQVTVGPMAIKNVKEFYVNKLFVGVDGYADNVGFTGSNMMRVEMVRAMRDSAKSVSILTDSSKFKQQGLLSQLRLNDVDSVFTDCDIDINVKQYLISKDVKVFIS